MFGLLPSYVIEQAAKTNQRRHQHSTRPSASNMTTKPQTRLPYIEPTHPHDPISPYVPARKIRFLHPGYPRSSNILLQFSAYDANHGIYYQAAQDACAVVANSRWDGFFSTDREGHERVDPEKLPGRSLNQDEYYFQVPRLGNTHGRIRTYPCPPMYRTNHRLIESRV